MVTLDAVNEILEVIGETPITTVPTSNDGTVEWRASDTLTKEATRVQGENWWWHLSEFDVDLTIPDVEIAVSGGSGVFTYGETVRETSTNATGTFDVIHNDKMYLRKVSGTFTGSQTLTGLTSSSTRTGAAYAAVTSAPLGVDFANWLRIRRHIDHRNQTIEDKEFAIKDAIGAADSTGRYRLLFDLDNNDYTWDEKMRVDRLVKRDFQDLPDRLTDYVLARTKMRFQKAEKRGHLDHLLIQEEILHARAEAFTENHQAMGWRGNMLQSMEHRNILGKVRMSV